MTAKKTTAQEPPMPGRSVTDFKNQYDYRIVIPKKIEEALARIGKTYRTSLEFQKEANVSMSDLNNFREQYADYVVLVKVDGKTKDIWFGDLEAAAEARESVR